MEAGGDGEDDDEDDPEEVRVCGGGGRGGGGGLQRGGARHSRPGASPAAAAGAPRGYGAVKRGVEGAAAAGRKRVLHRHGPLCRTMATMTRSRMRMRMRMMRGSRTRRKASLLPAPACPTCLTSDRRCWMHAVQDGPAHLRAPACPPAGSEAPAAAAGEPAAAMAAEQAGGEAGPSKPSASKKRKAAGGEGGEGWGKIEEGLSGARRRWRAACCMLWSRTTPRCDCSAVLTLPDCRCAQSSRPQHSPGRPRCCCRRRRGSLQHHCQRAAGAAGARRHRRCWRPPQVLGTGDGGQRRGRVVM